MNILKNSSLFFNFILNVRAVNREKGSYHKYVNRVAENEISRTHNINDGSITRLHFLKIQWYMATNLYLGVLIAGLRPDKLTLSEKKALVYLGALMAITDLMTDDFRLETEKISKLLKGDVRESAKLSAIEKIFLLYHEKLNSVIDEEKVAYIRDFSLRKPHLESQLQLKQKITEAEIHQLTREKGGTAMLLTVSLLIDISEKNKKAFYQLGAFIQYLNDSQDIYKDARAGVTTFISLCHKFSEVNTKLEEEFDQTITLMLQTDFPLENLHKLLFDIHAMYIGIIYKNNVFTRKLGQTINMSKIRSSESAEFQVNMNSFRSFRYCFPRIFMFSI